MKDHAVGSFGEALAIGLFVAIFVGGFIGVWFWGTVNTFRTFRFLRQHRDVMWRRMMGDRKANLPPFRRYINVYRYPWMRRLWFSFVWLITLNGVYQEYWKPMKSPVEEMVPTAVLGFLIVWGLDAVATRWWLQRRKCLRDL